MRAPMTEAVPETRTGAVARWIGRASRHPHLVLLLILAVQTLPTLWVKDVWFTDETRHAAAFMQMVENGHWLVLYLSDVPYPDKPPLYFWMVAGMSWLVGSREPVLFNLAAALSAGLLVSVTVFAARQFGLGRRVALLAGLILLSNQFFIERAHMPRMDLLFAAFIVLGHVFFFKAYDGKGRRTKMWALAGFAATAAALLTKGPVGLLMPLLSLTVWLARQRRWTALRSKTTLAGLGLLLAVGALYLVGVYLVEGPDFIRAILIDQTLNRAVDTPRLSNPVYFYLHKLAEILLPWSLILFFLPWRRLGQPALWRRLVRADPHAGARQRGLGYVWCALLVSLGLISSFDYKIAFLLVPLYPLCALLIAEAILDMATGTRRAYFLSIGLLLAAVAAALPFAHHLTLWPERVQGGTIVMIATLPLVGAALALRGSRPLAFGLAMAVGMTLAVLPYYLITIRGLNDTMSPRAQAEILAARGDAGDALYFYHPHSGGIYDYHAGRAIAHVSTWPALARAVAANDCGTVAMREKDWRQRAVDLPNPVAVDRRIIDYDIYVVMAWRADGAACAAAS
ncbi:hypothetical protein C7T96_19980 [Nitratireductor sp. StC3]|nr:hypothetical protein C7T96_19980 [Nitratireductor sp. StC3]